MGVVMPKLKLGELLVKSNLVTTEQFQHALDLQMLTPSQPIGQILCQLNFISKKDLNYVLDFNNKRQKLGEILISQNLIDESRLNSALEMCREWNIPLGRALIKQHLIEEEQLAKAIAFQHDMHFVDLSNFKLAPELASVINASYAHRCRLVPIKLEGKSLTLAMAHPLGRDELNQLEGCCQLKITPVIAKETDIALAQQQLFKVAGSFSREELHFEVSEEPSRGTTKSKYVSDFISEDVDYLVKRIITTGIRHNASDIHLESTEYGMLVRFRIDGVLLAMDLGAVDTTSISNNARQIVSKIKVLCDMDIAERRRPQDSSFKIKVATGDMVRNVDFRVSSVPTQFGENVVIRILDKHSGPMSLESLGFSSDYVKELNQALDKPTGIFLVTGPTGSGKSSTLYAILNRLNTPGVKTLTIEDPIEYVVDGITQTEVNEIIGNTFAKLLRAFLRQDPDNIMVGEIRDLETATISMRAAMTGHTVLSTLHTNDATSSVTRLLDMGVDPGQQFTLFNCPTSGAAGL
jgi:type II secretory ATPase GspE/PulE/Tfp pilus assembly ATPase PilB-like protein